MLSFEGMTRPLLLREGHSTATRVARRFLSLLIFAFFVGQLQGAGLVAGWPYTAAQASVPYGLTNATAVAAGDMGVIALRDDRTVVTWNYPSWAPLQTLSNVVAIAAGSWHALALLSDGKVVAAGDSSIEATNVPPDLSGVVAIAAGNFHSLALRSDGVVVAWGENGSGQTNVPAGLHDVVAIAAGYSHSLALRSDGTVITWGLRPDGLLDPPVGLAGVRSIAAGGSLSLALRTNGTVVAWGYGFGGLTNVPAGLSNVVMISTGDSHSLALRSDGSVVTWGESLPTPADLPPASSVAAGRNVSLAIVAEGPPRILRNPESAETVPQATVTFSVEATGPAPLGFQWFRGGNPIYESSTNLRLRGQTTDTLTITELVPSDTADYTVRVSTRYGSVMSAVAHLTVIGPPRITSASPGKTVGVGTDVNVWVAAEGTPPLDFRWHLEGANAEETTGPWLSLTNIQLAQSGVYFCIVTNRYGEARSGDIPITVTNRAPHSLYMRVPRQLPLGGSGTLRVEAHGSSPLHYQWRLNGSSMING